MSDDNYSHHILPTWAEKSGLDKNTLREFIRYLSKKNLVVCENTFHCTCPTLQSRPIIPRGQYGIPSSNYDLMCLYCAESKCSVCQYPTSLFYRGDSDSGDNRTVCFSCRSSTSRSNVSQIEKDVAAMKK